MRIKVQGNSPSAPALRGYLLRTDFAVSDYAADYTVILEGAEETSGRIVLDSVDCELEHSIFSRLRELTATAIEIQTATGNRSDRVIRVLIPTNEADRYAVEIGILRGLLQMRGEVEKAPPPKKKWWSRWRR